jgi:hypothetical protein
MNYTTNKIHAKTFLVSLFILLNSLLPCSVEGVEMTKEYRNFIQVSPENPYLSVLILIGFLIVLASIFKPKFGLVVMLLFILVSSDIQLDKSANSERGATVRIEDIILILVSFGWLMGRARTRSLSFIKNVPVNKGIIVMSLVMILATCIGYLQGTVPLQRGILFLIKRLEYFWIFFMVLHSINTYKEAAVTVVILLIVSVAVAFIGIFQFFLFPISELTAGGTTATAGFGRANTLADFYLIVTGLTLGMVMYLKEKRKVFLALITMSVFIFAIVMTKSRGAYVSLPPLFFAAYLISRKTKILFFAVSLILVFIVYYASIFLSGDAEILVKRHHEDIKGQFISIGSVAAKGPEADSSFNARYTAWRDITPKIFEYPLLGHGVGAMRLGYLDNQYVHEAYDSGIIGLMALLYMNFVIFMAVLGFFYATDDPLSKSLSLGFIAGQAGMLVHGMSMTNFYTILNMEAFWLIIALIMALYYNEMLKKKTVPNGVPG